MESKSTSFCLIIKNHLFLCVSNLSLIYLLMVERSEGGWMDTPIQKNFNIKRLQCVPKQKTSDFTWLFDLSDIAPKTNPTLFNNQKQFLFIYFNFDGRMQWCQMKRQKLQYNAVSSKFHFKAWSIDKWKTLWKIGNSKFCHRK